MVWVRTADTTVGGVRRLQNAWIVVMLGQEVPKVPDLVELRKEGGGNMRKLTILAALLAMLLTASAPLVLAQQAPPDETGSAAVPTVGPVACC